MKNHPVCFLSLFVLLNSTAHAGPRPRLDEQLVRELEAASGEELKILFDVRNPKGESIFKRRRVLEPLSLEKGIWSTRDPEKDGIEGTSTDKLYRKFRIRTRGKPVIVAVIDSGVDVSHPELQNKIWINEPELRGTPGVDDDQNGYIDDIHGWNYLGNKDGRNLNQTNLEVARLYSVLKRRDSEGTLNHDEKKELLKVTDELNASIASATKLLVRYRAFQGALELLKSKGLREETLTALEEITSDGPEVDTALSLAKTLFSNGITSIEVKEGVDHFQTQLDYHLNPGFDASAIIGDDPANLSEVGYGNPDVTGPDSVHGTHVAGIIAADRSNFIGIEGQAHHVKIMVLRAVPDGDERDKDVANAIRYAVNHGAKIINMSFGKPYSPDKQVVDDAVRHAQSRGVLLIHSAGNNGENTDGSKRNFPNRKLGGSSGDPQLASNWIEVGASGPTRDKKLAASFSNYGKNSVDVFAPGVSIVSTTPGNSYQSLNGTSMAAPQVAGIAALLLGKVPEARISDIKAAILFNVNEYPDLMCDLPGTSKTGGSKTVAFSSLSVTGGTVNAYKAMRWLLTR